MSEDNLLPLSSQFEIEVLRRLFENNPQKASELALRFYEDYWVLYQEYKALQKAYLKSRNDLFM